jgi:parallel beta-helix repeat protein
MLTGKRNEKLEERKMKRKLKLNSVLILLLLGFMISFVNISSQEVFAEILTSSPYEYPIIQAYTPHGPIYIDYDDNFTDYGFPGDGSAGDPFRIEDLNITISGDYPILFSGNNTKHFVIQNCFLKTDTNIGIYLGKYYKMGEGTVNILYNIIDTEYREGILLYGGNYSVISGNSIESYAYGVSIQYGYHSFVSENIIAAGDDDGISLEHCDNSTISRNNCTRGFNGIYTYQSSNLLINNNNCTQNHGGIYIDEGTNNTIISNVLVDNSNFGIDTNYCYDSIFRNNLLQENSNYGIYINLNSDNNIIHHNAFIDNGGVSSQAKDDGANNVWYDTISLEGNFWSNWVSGSYSIDGTASSVDPYPLGSMPVIPEFTNSYLILIILLGFLAIPLINLNRMKKNN